MHLLTPDPLDAVHKFGVAVLFLIVVFGLFVYSNLRKKAKKSKSKNQLKTESIDRLDKNAVLLLLIVIGVAVTIFIDGIIEIAAGAIVIFLALWLSEIYPNSCRYKA
jgi:membrane protein YdbS with pleckstrin-like domain